MLCDLPITPPLVGSCAWLGVSGAYVSAMISVDGTSVYEAVCARLVSLSWLECNHTSLQLQSHRGTHVQITRITSYSWQEIWHHKPSSRDQLSKISTLWRFKVKIVLRNHLWCMTVAQKASKCVFHISDIHMKYGNISDLSILQKSF